MRTAVLFFAALLTCAGADPVFRLIPPDATFLSGIRVTRSVGSSFGQYVLSQMEPEDDNFPHRAVTVLLKATSGEGDHEKSLTIAQGAFHPAQCAEAAIARGARVSPYRGVPIISKENNAIAFPDSTTALAGDPESIRAAIDRLASTAPENAARSAKIRELSEAHDAWFLSMGPVAEYFAGRIEDERLGAAVRGSLLSRVLQASGGLKFEADGVRIAGQAVAPSEKDANALRDVVRFIAGLVQVNQGPGPRVSLAGSLRVTVDGATVRMSVSIPEATVERLFLPKSN